MRMPRSPRTLVTSASQICKLLQSSRRSVAVLPVRSCHHVGLRLQSLMLSADVFLAVKEMSSKRATATMDLTANCVWDTHPFLRNQIWTKTTPRRPLLGFSFVVLWHRHERRFRSSAWARNKTEARCVRRLGRRGRFLRRTEIPFDR
jgi:hypothetical protein